MNRIKQFFQTFFRSGAANLELQELKKQILELQEQRIRDPLTRVYNRRFLEEVGEKEFALAKRYQRPLTLIFLDIDEFKKINDQQGHLVGDQALKTVAALLSNYSRKSDFIFRYGGDEFLIIFPQTTVPEASNCAERCQASLASERFPAEPETALPGHGQAEPITISVGIVQYNESVIAGLGNAGNHFESILPVYRKKTRPTKLRTFHNCRASWLLVNLFWIL